MAHKDAESNTVGFMVGGDQQDELFDVLSHHRRRFTLQYLQTAESPPVSVDVLTTTLGSWEDQRTGPAQVHTSADTADIKLSLVHTHLPKMADADVITYDPTRQTVMLAANAPEMDAYLQAMTDDR